MARVTFDVQWHGEAGAGINPGSDVVSIEFEYTPSFAEDEIAILRDMVSEFFEGAKVTERKKKNST